MADDEMPPERVQELERLVRDMATVILNRCDTKDPKVRDVILRAIETSEAIAAADPA